MTQGNIVIRFSAENQEVVRQALQQLGKDGEKAMRQMDAAAQPTSRSMGAFSSIMDELRGRATGLAFSLGPVGSGLIALGPAGLAAAAAFGGVIKVFSAWAEASDEFVQKAREIKEAAQTAGLSITEFKAIRGIGAELGKDAQQVSNGLDKLTVAIEEARRGTGPLYEQLMRIDAAMARDVATTLSTADAIDALGQAYKRLSQSQKNELDRGVFNRSGIGLGEIVETIRDRGGMEALRQGSANANKETEELIKTVSKLRVEIDTLNSKTNEMWGGAGSVRYLQYQKEVAEDWNKISKAIFGAVDALKAWASVQPPAQPRGPGRTPSLWREPAPNTVRRWGTGRAPGMFVERPLAESQTPAVPAIGPWDTKVRAEPNAAQQLDAMRRWTSLLGEAITPTEQLALKDLELKAAVDATGAATGKNTEVLAAASRGLEAYRLAQDRAAVSMRTQLGIADQAEMAYQAFRDLRAAEAKGFIKDAEEFATASKLVMKSIEDTANSMRVRASDTPALTRLSIDADRLKFTLDEGLSGALRGTTSDMLEMAKGTKTVSEGLEAMIVRISDAVAQALLMKAVVKPIADSLSGGLTSLFGGSSGSGPLDLNGLPLFGSARGNVFSAGALTPFVRGGIFDRPTIFPMAKGAGLMGEAGPEAVMPLRRLGNGRLGVSTEGAMPQVNFITQVVNNHPTAQVSQRDEEDGGGGRRSVIVIDEMVAQAASRPRSLTAQALAGQRSMVRR